MKHLKQSANKAALHLCPVMSFSDGVGCCIKLPHNTSLQDHAAHEKYMLLCIISPLCTLCIQRQEGIRAAINPAPSTKVQLCFSLGNRFLKPAGSWERLWRGGHLNAAGTHRRKRREQKGKKRRKRAPIEETWSIRPEESETPADYMQTLQV